MKKDFSEFVEFLKDKEIYNESLFKENIDSGATKNFFYAVEKGINEHPLAILQLYHDWLQND